ncbi:F-box protein skip19-like [Trifolium pratense]|uniref:F-box protein skip19-like n=2 Tax=Trifolium pratense TaxID=57577 RepID=A0A2K3P530_TRIPR|nr:F-box protein skip19-like [Trifolium pratense]
MDTLPPPPPPPPPPPIFQSNWKALIKSRKRNWLDLPRDVVLTIFRKLGTIDTLHRAHNVCTTWRNISKDPFLYHTIDMPNIGTDLSMDWYLELLCNRAVDYSSGQVTDINIEHFGTDDVLNHIADSVSHLRRLRLVGCYGVTDEGLCEVAEKFPHLEELDITISSLSDTPLQAIGRHCHQLKTFKFNIEGFRHPHMEYDDEAFAIAKTMPGLRHLQLFGNKMSNAGLLAILDGCPLLESLDIRQCFNLNLVGSLGKRCKEQIKYLRRPYDATDDYPFQAEFHYGSPDEEYPDGISDIDFLSDDDFAYYEFSGGSEFSDYDGYEYDF